MGVLGSVCSLNVGGEHRPTEWEDFLEEAVPGKGLDSGQGLHEGLFCGGHDGLDPDSEWSCALDSQFAHLRSGDIASGPGSWREGWREECLHTLAHRAPRVCMVSKA